jgi:RNA polymerase sigma-70 factor (ECF subfamily)
MPVRSRSQTAADGGPPPLRLRPAPDGEERAAFERDLAVTWMRGERAAAAALWDHFVPLVRGMLVRALGPGADVDDALQEVFLRIFHKGRTLRDPTCLRSFVVAISVHFIRSEFRKRRLRRLVCLSRDGILPELPEGSAQPAARMALHTLYRALDRLPARGRLAFTLRFFEGAEIGEAAALMHTSTATFKRWLTAAKRDLWALTGEDPWLAPYLAADEGAA